jgi:hypothetical protein
VLVGAGQPLLIHEDVEMVEQPLHLGLKQNFRLRIAPNKFREKIFILSRKFPYEEF